MQRGEVWFAATPGGDRPALVLTRDPIVDRIGSVVVAAITLTVRGLVVELEPSQLTQVCQRLSDTIGCRDRSDQHDHGEGSVRQPGDLAPAARLISRGGLGKTPGQGESTGASGSDLDSALADTFAVRLHPMAATSSEEPMCSPSTCVGTASPNGRC